MARRGENIRKRTDGRWEGRYGETINGKSISHSIYGPSYAEVKQKLTAAKLEIEKKKKLTAAINVSCRWMKSHRNGSKM